ncbi:hypothetical protein I79_006557 [Cricetulus griseus]|uniref:Uncharacterized protein n=1 Tax=Cricetulus griseus TaxID=10029 RepID=G3H859_CRIGR|nr:hypothetical protein I79_006557 [Cricetulus griseus]
MAKMFLTQHIKLLILKYGKGKMHVNIVHVPFVNASASGRNPYCKLKTLRHYL